MKTIALFWGYVVGEEHLTEEQFAQIDFGNPQFDTEFITFDPLASSFFHGKYFTMYEKRLLFPHRTLPAMRSETMVMYDETNIRIIDPPVDLETPAGIFQCIFTGKESQIARAIKFMDGKINLRFSPCIINLEEFYLKLKRTRFQISPISLTIGDLSLSEILTGNLEVFPKSSNQFEENLRNYKPQNKDMKLIVNEVNTQLVITTTIDGLIKFETDFENLNMTNTIIDIATRSVFTSSL